MMSKAGDHPSHDEPWNQRFREAWQPNDEVADGLLAALTSVASKHNPEQTGVSASNESGAAWP